MKQFLITVAGVLVGGFLLLLLPLLFLMIVGSAISAFTSNSSKPEENTVLVYNLETIVTDYQATDPIGAFSAAFGGNKYDAITLSKLTATLQAAAADDNISCLMLRGTSSGASYSAMKEILPYLNAFKESGKPIYYFDSSMDQSALYLASSADSVFVVPTGMLMIHGLSGTYTYYKNALDKFGIDVQIIRHGKYKSAVEPFMSDHMSDAAREQTQKYLDAIWNDMRTTIATNRNISSEQVDEYANKLNFAELQSAIDAKLIDRCIYKDEYLAMIRKEIGLEPNQEIKTISVNGYSTTLEPADDLSNNKLAVIYAQGEILDGTANGIASDIYGDDLARTIRQARTDDDVKSIVLRVNSPGGSALASDIIWREVKLTSLTKPIVVSMGQYAASGGYYISCAANHIFAEPTTITGSIGIFGMVPCVQKAANNIGLNFDTVNTNEQGIPTLTQPLSDGWKDLLQKRIEAGYQTFITRCADGRQTTTEHIDSIGQGRVWAGSDAINIGLVDQLGSLNDAIDYAAQLANMGEDYEISELPTSDESLAAMLKQLGMNTRATIGKCLLGKSYDIVQKIEKISDMPMIEARIEYDIDLH